ncbi:hypothetical protein ACVWY5_000786 [Bradyrhizobium sp. USDA 3256]
MPSITIRQASFATEGFWKPSSIRITLASCARASARPAARSRDTTTGKHAAIISGSSPTSAAVWLSRSTLTGPASLPP